MTPPDSGEREVCGWRHDLLVGQCELPRGHNGMHEVSVAEGTAVIPISLAHRILAALEQDARAGNVSAHRLEALAAELRARMEGKA